MAPPNRNRISVQSGRLTWEFDPVSARWSCRHGALGCAIEGAQPSILIDGLAWNPQDCQYQVERFERKDWEGAGPLRAVETVYAVPGGPALFYTFVFMPAADPDGFTVALTLDYTAGETPLTIHRMTPIDALRVTPGGRAADWMVTGGPETDDAPGEPQPAAGPVPLDFRWHGAVQNPATGHCVLMGTLSDHEGQGYCTVAAAGEDAVRMQAWIDYEGLVVEPGEDLLGERVLVTFGTDGDVARAVWRKRISTVPEDGDAADEDEVAPE